MTKSNTKIFLTILLSVIVFISGCTKQKDDTAPALVLTVNYNVKQLQFSWTSVAGVTHYRLMENQSEPSDYQQVGEVITGTSITLDVAVHDSNWDKTRYRISACNVNHVCTESNEVSIQDQVLKTIGYLKASNPGAGDEFGLSIAFSRDGKTLAVGAFLEDSNSTGVNSKPNESAQDAGAVYIYVLDSGSWIQQAFLKASNADDNDYFGYQVALSADGNTLAVGAVGEASSTTGINSRADDLANDAGAVYVFTRTDQKWSEQAYIKASNTGAQDRFGHSVALSDDGNTLAVGAIFEDSSTTAINSSPNEKADAAGAVYVYTRHTEGWNQQAYIKASNADVEDWFGNSVALSSDGNVLAVGAIFEDSSTTGINTEANELAEFAGAVYIFNRANSIWSQQAYIKASNAGSGDEFGWSLALSADGNTLAVGAVREGSSTSGINTSPNDFAENAGAAYVFRYDGLTWAQQAYIKASNPGIDNDFGKSVALSGDGGLLAVGADGEGSSTTGINSTPDQLAERAGAVYTFRQSGPSWQQVSYIKASNTHAGDGFGTSIALSADGKSLAVAALGESGSNHGINSKADDAADRAGSVYLY